MTKRWLIGTGLLGAAAIGIVILTLNFLAEEIPPGLLLTSGRIEGRITTVTPKSSARVVEIQVDEGEVIEEHATLALLDDEALRERVRSTEESLGSLRHSLQAADRQLELLREKTPLQIERAESAVLEAKARIASRNASYLQAKKDAERYQRLAEDNQISQHVADSAQLKAITAKNAQLEAEAGLAKAEQDLALAKLGEQQVAAQEAERNALNCKVRQAEAALAEQQSYVQELTIRSPLSGTVLTRNIERGERVSPGTPLFTLVDLDRLYLKVYVPEPDIGKLALGQVARVFVDAYSDRFFRAKVTKVSQQAEFTPKMVETREERVKLVFAIELSLQENPGGVLKPGMPADAVIRWQEDAPWVTP